jgi:RNA polymerase sigma-70 factor (ECF subfamily)
MAESLLYTDEDIAQMYERHVKTVYRICFAHMKNVPDTEDAVQNTFIRLMSCGKVFKDTEHEKAWLIVTATNICKDHHRHWWRKTVPLKANMLCNASVTMEIDETFDVILSMPDKYKTTIYLYYYEGYNSSDIAALLRIPPSTVRSYLYKGRKLLKEKLGGESYDKQADVLIPGIKLYPIKTHKNGCWRMYYALLRNSSGRKARIKRQNGNVSQLSWQQ